MTLIQMYEEAKKKNKLPKEFERWEDLRTWAITNRYKAEYGYKGEFTPEGCLKAMPDYKPLEEINKLKEDIESGKKTINAVRNEIGLEPICEGEEPLIVKEGEKNASKKTSNRSKRSKIV